jgi:hypothetical protein
MTPEGEGDEGRAEEGAHGLGVEDGSRPSTSWGSCVGGERESEGVRGRGALSVQYDRKACRGWSRSALRGCRCQVRGSGETRSGHSGVANPVAMWASTRAASHGGDGLVWTRERGREVLRAPRPQATESRGGTKQRPRRGPAEMFPPPGGAWLPEGDGGTNSLSFRNPASRAVKSLYLGRGVGSTDISSPAPNSLVEVDEVLSRKIFKS